MLQQRLLVQIVEAQRIENGYGGGEAFDYRGPDVEKVHTVRLLAESASSKAGGGCDPEDNAHWDELEDAVPNSLLGVSRSCQTF